MIGDSHARDWVHAFEVVSKRLAFNVTSRVKMSCPPTLTALRKWNEQQEKCTPYLECQQWTAKSIKLIIKAKPLAVVFIAYQKYIPIGVPGTINIYNGTEVADGVVQVAEQLIAADIPVLCIKATPIMPEPMPDCLAKEVRRNNAGGGSTPACSILKQQGLALASPGDMAASMYPMMRQMSFDNIFCPNGTCSGVIGNVVVYRDEHHLTTAFARSLAPILEQKLLEVAPHMAVH